MIVNVKKKKKPQRNGIIYVRLIPDNVKNYFKAYCAKRGKSMSEVLIEFMERTVSIAQKVDRQQEREQREADQKTDEDNDNDNDDDEDDDEE